MKFKEKVKFIEKLIKTTTQDLQPPSHGQETPDYYTKLGDFARDLKIKIQTTFPEAQTKGLNSGDTKALNTLLIGTISRLNASLAPTNQTVRLPETIDGKEIKAFCAALDKFSQHCKKCSEQKASALKKVAEEANLQTAEAPAPIEEPIIQKKKKKKKATASKVADIKEPPTATPPTIETVSTQLQQLEEKVTEQAMGLPLDEIKVLIAEARAANRAEKQAARYERLAALATTLGRHFSSCTDVRPLADIDSDGSLQPAVTELNALFQGDDLFSVGNTSRTTPFFDTAIHSPANMAERLTHIAQYYRQENASLPRRREIKKELKNYINMVSKLELALESLTFDLAHLERKKAFYAFIGESSEMMDALQQRITEKTAEIASKRQALAEQAYLEKRQVLYGQLSLSTADSPTHVPSALNASGHRKQCVEYANTVLKRLNKISLFLQGASVALPSLSEAAEENTAVAAPTHPEDATIDVANHDVPEIDENQMGLNEVIRDQIEALDAVAPLDSAYYVLSDADHEGENPNALKTALNTLLQHHNAFLQAYDALKNQEQVFSRIEATCEETNRAQTDLADKLLQNRQTIKNAFLGCSVPQATNTDHIDISEMNNQLANQYSLIQTALSEYKRNYPEFEAVANKHNTLLVQQQSATDEIARLSVAVQKAQSALQSQINAVKTLVPTNSEAQNALKKYEKALEQLDFKNMSQTLQVIQSKVEKYNRRRFFNLRNRVWSFFHNPELTKRKRANANALINAISAAKTAVSTLSTMGPRNDNITAQVRTPETTTTITAFTDAVSKIQAAEIALQTATQQNQQELGLHHKVLRFFGVRFGFDKTLRQSTRVLNQIVSNQSYQEAQKALVAATREQAVNRTTEHVESSVSRISTRLSRS